MTRHFLALIFLTASLSFGQNTVIVGSSTYDSLKAAGALNKPITTGYFLYNEEKIPNVAKPILSSYAKSNHCYGYTPPNAPAIPQLQGVDDGCTGLISLPFNFCFYGTSQTGFYINSNGNITFGSCYTTFTPTGFPMNTTQMIAPFWGDVDFDACGMCYYEIFPDAAIIHWYDAGYYNAHCDKINNFQLIITDGVSSLLSPGSNVGFFYDDMQWTTGDASGGVGGFGGSPATVGVNRGNGTDYIQIGRFDQSGMAYDGPFNANDGVDWLDDNYFMFNVCSSTNIPPIISGLQVCDTIRLCVGDTLQIDLDFLSPEVGQITDATVNFNGTPDFTLISSQAGNTADMVVEFAGTNANIGANIVDFTVWDNGTPPDTLQFNIVIVIDTLSIPPPVLTGQDTVCLGDSTTLYAGNNFESYLWNTGSTDSIIQVPTGSYWFTATHEGCSANSDTINVYVNHPPIPTITGDSVICNDDIANLSTAPGFESYLWNTNDTTINIVVSDSGMYTIEAFDEYGCVGRDTFYVQQYEYIIPGNNEICGLVYDMTSTQSNGGYWSYYNADGNNVVIDSSNSSLNPSFTFENEGEYYLIFSDQFCYEVDTTLITAIIAPEVQLEDFVLCEGEIADIVPLLLGSEIDLNYFWSNNSIVPAISVQQPGNYILTLINQCGSDVDTATVEVFPCSLNVPNFLSPNGDGSNDVLVIEGLEYFQAELSIFNRWGQLIYYSSDYQNDWSGMNMDGKMAVDGTYYYILKAVRSEDEFIRKGHITLNY